MPTMSFAAVPKIVLHEVPMQPYYAGVPLADTRHPVIYVIQNAFDFYLRVTWEFDVKKR